MWDNECWGWRMLGIEDAGDKGCWEQRMLGTEDAVSVNFDNVFLSASWRIELHGEGT